MGSGVNQGTAIFLVESSHETCLILKKILQTAGYRVIVALDEKDALGLAQSGLLEADLIFVGQGRLEAEQALNLGRQLREYLPCREAIPIIVAAEDYGEELCGQDIAVGSNQYLAYLEDAAQLIRLVARLTARQDEAAAVE